LRLSHPASTQRWFAVAAQVRICRRVPSAVPLFETSRPEGAGVRRAALDGAEGVEQLVQRMSGLSLTRADSLE
jgi:hypothetical protein